MSRGAVKTAAVFTHRKQGETSAALALLFRLAAQRGVELVFDSQEAVKHGLVECAGIRISSQRVNVDLAIALGGDGTILRALRAFVGTAVPVFGVNFGEIGFLATAEKADLEAGIKRALANDFDVLMLPAVDLSGVDGGVQRGINDVALHRKPGMRVARLAYAIGDDQVGEVRCDGLVVSTPAGSTGYNLANGGPVMAWGVEGLAVSFVAPHSLSARVLVVAPGDVLRIQNKSPDEPVEVAIDGRPVCELPPGESVETRFMHDQAALAQLPGANFYHRLREKFTRLSA